MMNLFDDVKWYEWVWLLPAMLFEELVIRPIKNRMRGGK